MMPAANIHTDIFHAPISTFIDRPDPTRSSSTPTDLDISIAVREKSRVVASSGTWAGSNDGSVYFNLLLRNIFGGAESLNANASFGTRTRSAYSAELSTPVLGDPDVRFEVGGLQSATQKVWASHDERLRGGSAKVKWLTPSAYGFGLVRQEFGFQGLWRQVTNLADTASSTVRADAGDSFKASLTHTMIADGRDNPLLPTSGNLVKTSAELAGIGPLGGDVAFAKLEAETQSNFPLFDNDVGISVSASLRGGLLYPLALPGASKPSASRINDRFFLGGPTDIRGFRFNGLGPHDGHDAVGGDVYAAGGISLLAPFPRVGKDSPLRLQAFINGGRLLALPNIAREKSHGHREDMTGREIRQAVGDAFAELGSGLPSFAAGVGLVYALPVARFELNFSLPIAIRRGEQARKGLQLGVGISFL